MSNTNWNGNFSFFAKHTDIDSTLRASFLPIKWFKVQGGVKRVVHLENANESVVPLEFEQARIYKNISLFLSRTKGYEWFQLWEIADHGLRTKIIVNICDRGAQDYTLTSESAKINGKPIKMQDWENNDMLRIDFSIPESKLVHGYYEGSEFVKEDW